jgi:hypothetical protein
MSRFNCFRGTFPQFFHTKFWYFAQKHKIFSNIFVNLSTFSLQL